MCCYYSDSTWKASMNFSTVSLWETLEQMQVVLQTMCTHWLPLCGLAAWGDQFSQWSAFHISDWQESESSQKFKHTRNFYTHRCCRLGCCELSYKCDLCHTLCHTVDTYEFSFLTDREDQSILCTWVCYSMTSFIQRVCVCIIQFFLFACFTYLTFFFNDVD